jgi:hypothetical protein
MTPMIRGLLVTAIHLAIVSSLGGKLLYDRATRPRQWVHVGPVDPNLPIRGRYIRLQIIGDPSGQQIAFFIPEHAADPSFRPAGEELWAEVTLPRSGPPRPIRLGVKKNGVLTPLE